MDNLYGIEQRNQPFGQFAQNRMYGGTPQDQYSEDYFAYPVFFEALAPGTTARGVITIQKDADFEWIQGTYLARVPLGDPVTALDVQAPYVNVEIVDNGSGRNLLSQTAPVETLFGTGKLPHVMVQPRIFKATSTIIFNVTSVAALTTYDLFLVLEGVKIFNYNLRRGAREALAAQEAQAAAQR